MRNKKIVLVELIVMSMFFLIAVIFSFGIIVGRGNWQKGMIFNKITQNDEFKATGNIINIKGDVISYNIDVIEHSENFVAVESSITGDLELLNIYQDGETIYFIQENNIAKWFNMDHGEVIVKIPKGYNGDIDISTVSGNIETQGDIVNTELLTVSGSIKVYSPGKELAAKSTSGSIKVYKAYEKLNVGSTSGSLKIVADKNSKEYILKAVSGSIKIQLDDDIGYKLTYSTVSGGVKDEYIDGSYKHSGVTKYGDERLNVNASSVTGSIKMTDWE